MISLKSVRLFSLQVQIILTIGFFFYLADSNDVKSMTLLPELTNELVSVSFPLNLLSILIIFLLLCVLVIILYQVRYRSNKGVQTDQQEDGLQILSNQLEAIFEAENHGITVIWSDSSKEPKIIGKFAEKIGLSTESQVFLNFEDWLPEQDVAMLNSSIELLHAKNRTFDLELKTKSGLDLVVIGKKVGNLTVVRFRELDERKTESAERTTDRELESVAIETSQSVKIQPNSLNYLSIAVAIFNSEQQLVFFNEAYQKLWEFDDAFLNSQPSDGEVLNALRLQRKLPEQANYMEWRNDILKSYQATEVRNFFWYLPDNRTLRVFVIPRSSGGVIYFFENVTEQIRFESRVNTMNRVQGETLDHLSDAVAVFGSNGRIRLWNPTFAELWQQNSKFLKEFPHISEISQRINLSEKETGLWNTFATEVTQVSEVRTKLSGQIERKDGIILDYSLAPLPDGGMLITFVDVTASINIERALIEKNEALRLADELKNNFIQHVSYEFRSPLTSIIGFAQMLSDPKLGTLTSKQSEYMEHILASSSALLALIDDILDLATIDAGIMELELVEVDIQETVQAVTEGINDRLINSNVELKVQLPEEVGKIVADRSRLRQILFNLVSNAVNFSTDRGKVEIICERSENQILFKISDNGSGIPKEFLPKVFENFVSWGQGEKRRGVGLGLPIVKRFVEMHGGQVSIESEEGSGTLVTVTLPITKKSKKIKSE